MVQLAKTDVAKAFDTVPRQILLDDLETFGVGSNILTLLKSYLTNRYLVMDNGNENVSTESEYGVTQGSKLGPILYAVFTSSLLQCSYHHTIRAFVDDNILLKSYATPDDRRISMDLQEDMSAMQKWYNKRAMKLNAKKTTTIHLTRNSNCNETINILGVIFDSNLSFDTHIAATISKIHKLSFLMKRLRKVLSKGEMRVIVLTKVVPIVTYGLYIWSNTSKYHVAKATVAYNRCIWAAFNLPLRTSITSSCNQFDIPTFGTLTAHAHIRGIADAIRNQNHPAHFVKKWFHDGKDTRKPKQFKFCVEGNISTFKKNSFPYKSKDMWNALPYETRSLIHNCCRFKCRLSCKHYSATVLSHLLCAQKGTN